MRATKLRVATMKRQMLLKPVLQTDVAIVNKDKDILVLMILAL